ncbi:MAG: AbrB family transcriptional regulator [Roseiarcus sp.]|jgi:antitoxin MazE
MNVSKWGHSLAVRLPGKIVEALRLEPRETLDFLDDSTGAAALAEQRRRALDELAALNWALPADYKFDRDEANAR